MGKKNAPKQVKQSVQLIQNRLLLNEMRMLSNYMFGREGYMKSQEDGQGRDFDKEFGYPAFPLTSVEYDRLWREESVAKRIVEVFPQECWSAYPELTENDKPAFTPFEKKWKKLEKQIHPWHYLHRADTLSGIGRYGVLLLGLNDGRPLSEPVKGIKYDKRKAMYVNAGAKHEVIYLRAFQESLIQIAKVETDRSNRRYGEPTLYNIQFGDATDAVETPAIREAVGARGENEDDKTVYEPVHWTRIIHLADNRSCSEVFGIPRMEQVGRRIYDIRKILGGSAEMFWRGAFPGYAFTSDGEDVGVEELDEDSLQAQFEEYSKGLKRYIALIGMKAQSLAPQVADPTGHMMQQLQMICIALGVPMRIFMGSEAGHLASDQDAITWNRRLSARQTQYLNPMVIRPFIDRCMLIGTLPQVEDYSIKWNDINNASDGDKADVALKLAQTILQYVSSGAEEILSVKMFFTKILGWKDEEADAALADLKKGAKLTKKIWEEPMKLSPATTGTKPTKKTGAGGRTNGLGKAKKKG